jgi:hypothetical protein
MMRMNDELLSMKMTGPIQLPSSPEYVPTQLHSESRVASAQSKGRIPAAPENSAKVSCGLHRGAATAFTHALFSLQDEHVAENLPVRSTQPKASIRLSNGVLHGKEIAHIQNQ